MNLLVPTTSYHFLHVHVFSCPYRHGTPSNPHRWWSGAVIEIPLDHVTTIRAFWPGIRGIEIIQWPGANNRVLLVKIGWGRWPVYHHIASSSIYLLYLGVNNGKQTLLLINHGKRTSVDVTTLPRQMYPDISRCRVPCLAFACHSGSPLNRCTSAALAASPVTRDLHSETRNHTTSHN